jgi:hypothetical protein
MSTDHNEINSNTWETYINKASNLLDQMIEKKEIDDFKSKKNIETGDSWDLHHLKLLKELIQNGINACKEY